MLSVRLEVGVSLLLVPAELIKGLPRPLFPLVENAGIQPAICKRVPVGSSGGSRVLLKALISFPLVYLLIPLPPLYLSSFSFHSISTSYLLPPLFLDCMRTLFPFSVFLSSFPLSSLLFSFLPFSFNPSFRLFLGLSSLCLSFPPSTFCFLFSSSLCLLCLPHIPYFTFQLHSHLSLFTLRYFPFPSLSLYLSYPYLISLLSSHLLCAFPFAFLPSLLFLFRLLNIQPIHVQLDCNGKCCFS